MAQKADRSRALRNAKMSAGEVRACSKFQVTPRSNIAWTGLRELRVTKVSANNMIEREIIREILFARIITTKKSQKRSLKNCFQVSEILYNYFLSKMSAEIIILIFPHIF